MEFKNPYVSPKVLDHFPIGFETIISSDLSQGPAHREQAPTPTPTKESASPSPKLNPDSLVGDTFGKETPSTNISAVAAFQILGEPKPDPTPSSENLQFHALGEHTEQLQLMNSNSLNENENRVLSLFAEITPPPYDHHLNKILMVDPKIKELISTKGNLTLGGSGSPPSEFPTTLTSTPTSPPHIETTRVIPGLLEEVFIVVSLSVLVLYFRLRKIE